MFRHRYLPNVTTLQLNSELCSGCGRCVEVCPHGVFRIENKKAVLTVKDFCMECGACKKNCQAGAIEVREGVGCAWSIVYGKLRGTAPTC
jgi:NAD-dependent dihydropyrimidine dehydrogenase PreA subunit